MITKNSESDPYSPEDKDTHDFADSIEKQECNNPFTPVEEDKNEGVPWKCSVMIWGYGNLPSVTYYANPCKSIWDLWQQYIGYNWEIQNNNQEVLLAIGSSIRLTQIMLHKSLIEHKLTQGIEHMVAVPYALFF